MCISDRCSPCTSEANPCSEGSAGSASSIPRLHRHCRFVLLGRRRDDELHPRAVALRPVLGLQIPVGAQINVAAVVFTQREHESDLRADPYRASLEGAELGAGSAVGADLLEQITD